MFSTRKNESRATRHRRIRMHVRGTSDKPRLAVFRSLNHIYAQIIDDVAGRTLVAVDSRAPDFQQKMKTGGNAAAAKLVGELLAQRATARGVSAVVFDRAGYQYHGRVKAHADAARAGGLKL